MFRQILNKIFKRKVENPPNEEANYQNLVEILERLKKELLIQEAEEPKRFEEIKKNLLEQRAREEKKILEKHSAILTQFEKKLAQLEKTEKQKIEKLRKQALRLEKKINFIKKGGNKPIIHLFEGLDNKLRQRFSWYLNWHLNPASSLIHQTFAGLFVVMMVLGISNTFILPKTPIVKSIITPKSILLTQLEKENKNIEIPKNQNAQEFDLGNAIVDFSNKEDPLFFEVKTLGKDKNSIKTLRFELLQPEEKAKEAESRDESKKISIKEKILSYLNIKDSSKNLYAKEEGKNDSTKNKASSSRKIRTRAKNFIKERNGIRFEVNNSLEIKYEIKKSSKETLIKETAIIKDLSVLSTNPDYHLAFNLNLEGLNYIKDENGGYILLEKNQGGLIRILPPTIEDKKGKGGNVSLEISNSQAKFIINPDFLKTAVFPLYLDPSVVIATSTSTNPSSYTKDRTLLEATNGSMIQIYSDGSAINYKISTDRGNNWGTASTIVNTSLADDYGFSCWITTDNKIHLVYSNNGSNSYIFYRQLTFDTGTNTITSTGTEYTVESSGTTQAFPTVSVSGSTIYVAYRYYDGSNYTVKVKASTSNGSSWSSATTLSATTSSQELYPALTIWNSKPAVIYNFANSALRWNYFNGSSWQSPGWTYETIATDIGSSLGTEFSISQTLEDNYLHLAFKDDSSGIKYRKLASGSDPSKWDTTSTSITSGSNHQNDRYPSIGIGFNNAIYLYYAEYISVNSYNIKLTEKIGSSGNFESSIAITSSGVNILSTNTALKPSYSSGKNPYSPVIYVSLVDSNYNLNYAPQVKVWAAAADGNWHDSANWSPSGAPQAGDVVIFDSTSVKNCTVTTYTSGNGIADGIGAIYINSGYTGTITFQKKPSQNSNPYNVNIIGDFFVNSGTVVSEGDTTAQHNGITDGQGNTYTAYNLVVAQGVSFNANSKGFAGTQGPGGAPSCVNFGCLGASYGGEGYGADPSKVYGNYSNPVSLGSGGSGSGRYGGGAIILNVSNTLAISGTISANGNGSTDYNTSGGSGGSINLSASTISGGGTISANGGDSYYAGGSGGRIKLSADTISFSGSIQAYGGKNSPTVAVGSAGTIYKKLSSQTYGELIINNGSSTPYLSNQHSAHLKSSSDSGTYQFDSITLQNYGKLAIDSSQTLNLTSGSISGDKNSGFVNAGTVIAPTSWTISYFFSDKNGTVQNLSEKSITITSSGRLSHYPNPSGNTEVYKLNWSVSSLTVESGGEISVERVGFRPTYGPGGSNSNSFGASYGGEGYGADPSKVYGDYSNPTNLGSGGNNYEGGGAIILNVSNTLAISGTISANGSGSTIGNSGGSGGSINLSASTISGGGTISANGGDSYYAGGSGGRIKLSADTISFSGSIQAYGGKNSPTVAVGSAGTIYKKLSSQTYGELIIDNSGASASTTAYTPLTAPKSFDSLTISNRGQLRIDVNSDPTQNTLNITGNLTLSSNSILKLKSDNDGNPEKGAGITVSAQNIDIGSGCSINSDGTGFPANRGYSNGGGRQGTTYGGGGAFGGAGGNSSDGGAGGQPYGSQNDVEYIGSGGGASGGGAGGGFMKLSVSNTLTNSGTISANGGNGTTNGGGGSGGGILIITNNISSTGTISANGGNGVANAGGGGGGRIFIITSGSSSIDPLPQVNGGTGANNGSSGSIYYQHAPSSSTLSSPENSSTNISQVVSFNFSTTDEESDWIRYKLQLATNSEFTENFSEFIQGDTQEGQTQTSNGITVTFSNQDSQNGTAYTSGREAIVSVSSSTPLDEGTTYYWRVYAIDPGGSRYWGPASQIRSFTVAPIDKITFTTDVNSVEVTLISAKMTVEIRNTINETVKLKQSQTFSLSVEGSTTGHFYSDSAGNNEITGFTLNPGDSVFDFYYKDDTASLTPYTIVVSENHPTSEGEEDWTNGTQEITVNSGALDHFIMSGYPSQIIAGENLGAITVEAIDTHSKRKIDFTGEVWFTSSDSQATIVHNSSNHYVFTSGIEEGNDNGIHTFSISEIILKTKGTQTINLQNDSGAPSLTSSDITVKPAAVDHFSISQIPLTSANYFAMGGLDWSVGGYSNAPYNPKVTVYDAYNNIKDDFEGDVWFEIYKLTDRPGNPGDSTVDYIFTYNYTNPYTFTLDDAGIHTFDGINFLINTAGNLRFRVKTSDNGGKYADSYITIKPQALDHFSVEASPVLSRNGVEWEKAVDTTFSEDIIVTAYDTLGNVKTNYAYDESSKYGMIYFYSSDTYAVVPYYKTSASDTSYCYQFPAEDSGIHTFTLENTPPNYFKFYTGGLQTLSVSECIDPSSSYGATKYDPRFETPQEGKTAVATGQLPEDTDTPNRIAVSLHQPGSTHTATNHSNDSNNLIEASAANQAVVLSWFNPFDYPTDESLDAQVYIYRCSSNCDNSENFSKISTNPEKVTGTRNEWSQYTDTGLENGTQYFYKLAYAYKKDSSNYIVSDFSNVVSATPADIAPRDVTATQLDVSDDSNPGKVKVEYKLRYTSTVSLAYFNPSSNSWIDASTQSMSGDIGQNIEGSEDLPLHTAYFDPNIDFDGQYLVNSFRMRVKVTVGNQTTYSDSSLFSLDSKNPENTSVIVNATGGNTATLSLNAEDNSPPIKIMVSNNENFEGASWEDYTNLISNWNIEGANTIYVKFRDNYNNISTVVNNLIPTPENIQIKDASNSTTQEFRLTIIWSKVNISNLKQYNIWRSTNNSTYEQIGFTSQNAYVDTDLDPTVTYYYKIGCEDNSGNLSRLPEPVYSRPGLAPDITADPQVSLSGWKQDVGVKAEITWLTDQLSDSFVAYSTEPLKEGPTVESVSGSQDKIKIVGTPDLVLDHKVTLYNLEPSTKYYFKVLSKNAIQIVGYSDTYNFTTPERILLLISGVSFSNITNNSAIVSWDTSKLSQTVLKYGKTTDYSKTIEDATWNTKHKFELKDLESGNYHLRIYATDQDGNVTISDDYVFTIPPYPVVSEVNILEIGETTAKISWVTNVACTSNVDIEGGGSSGSQGTPDMVTSHTVTLVGLKPKTTYKFVTRSIDQFGNVARGPQMSFTTTADTTPPKITNQQSQVTSTGSGENIKYQLIVTWETDEPATSKIEYGPGMGTASYPLSSKEDLSLNITHTVIISDLPPNSLYHYRIKTVDKSGNISFSEDSTIVTPPKQRNIFEIITNAITEPLAKIYYGILNRLRK